VVILLEDNGDQTWQRGERGTNLIYTKGGLSGRTAVYTDGRGNALTSAQIGRLRIQCNRGNGQGGDGDTTIGELGGGDGVTCIR